MSQKFWIVSSVSQGEVDYIAVFMYEERALEHLRCLRSGESTSPIDWNLSEVTEDINLVSVALSAAIRRKSGQ